MATNNLFNVPSWTSIQELFYRRLGIKLDPTLVTYSFNATNQTVTVTAAPKAADGSRSPFQGSITYPLDRLQVASELPATLVWSDLFPMTVDALADYLLKNYGYYLEDGEFFVVGDASATPLVRGGGEIYNGLNVQTRQFSLRATAGAKRWNPGSGILFQLATSNSIVPVDGFSITSAAPPAGNYEGTYTYTYTVSGGTPPYSFTVIEGTSVAPINPSTGVMSSNSLPALGDFSWIVQVEDSVGRIVTRQDTATVAQQSLVMAPATFNPAVTVGVPINFSLGVAGGVAPYAYSVYLNSLPSTVKVANGAVTGTFEGSLTQASSSLVVGLRVTDAVGATVQRLFTFTIADRTAAQIKASLCTKVIHWFEHSTGVYAGDVTTAAGGVLYDAVGHANMVIAPLPGFDSSASIGTLPGIGNQPTLFSLTRTAYAHTNTTAYNLPDDFAIMALVSFQSPGSVAGQALLSRGGDVNGGYELQVGADNTSLALELDMSGTPTSVAFPTQIAPGVGSCYHVILQKFGNVPEMVVNAGTSVDMPALTGALQPNNADGLFLGVHPDLNTTSQFVGGMGMISLFSEKLWSDERKWIYNAGTLRTFHELGYWPVLSLTANQPIGAGSLVIGQPFTATYTIAGGNATYLNVGLASDGVLPPGLSLSYDGEVTVTLSGTPTTPGTFDIDVQVSSTDGQTVNNSQSAVIAVPIAPLALSGTYAGGTAGIAYQQDLTISGGVPPYSLTNGSGLAAGTVPSGLTLTIVGSLLRLSGTPLSGGTVGTFTAGVGSSDGQSATSQQSVTVAPSQVVNPVPVTSGMVLDLDAANATVNGSNVLTGWTDVSPAGTAVPFGSSGIDLTLDAGGMGELPGVVITPSSNSITPAINWTGSVGGTIIAVLKNTLPSPGNNTVMGLQFCQSGGSNVTYYGYYGSVYEANLCSARAAALPMTTDQQALLSQPYIYTCHAGAEGGTFRINGEVIGTNPNPFAIPTFNEIGAGPYDGSTNQTIGQVLVYDRELSDQEIAEVETYLSDKYNVYLQGNIRPLAPHLYWRLSIAANTSNGSDPIVAAGGIEMRTSIGGKDIVQVGGVISPGIIPSASSNGSGQPASLAFQGYGPNLATPVNSWTSDGTQALPQFIQLQFPTPVAIAQLAYWPQQRADLVERSPSEFSIEYSDDGVTFVIQQTYTNIQHWALGIPKLFDVGPEATLFLPVTDGLVLDVDAALLTSSANGDVTTWPDLSPAITPTIVHGFNLVQGTSDINAFPGVTVVEGESWLEADINWADAVGGTIVAVLKNTNPSPSNATAFGLNFGSSDTGQASYWTYSTAGSIYDGNLCGVRVGPLPTTAYQQASLSVPYLYTCHAGAEGGSLRLNGAPVGSNPSPFAIPGQNQIGQAVYNSDYINQTYGRVLVYNRELSIAEITQVEAYMIAKYELDIITEAYPAAVLTDGPLAYYRCDDIVGTQVTDISGNDLHGILNMDASLVTAPGLLALSTDPGFDIQRVTSQGQYPFIRATYDNSVFAAKGYTVECILEPQLPPQGSVGAIVQAPENTSGGPELDVYDQGGGRFALRIMSSGTAQLFLTSNTWTYGTKLHIAYVGDVVANVTSCYVNGIFQGQYNAVYSPGTSQANWIFGAATFSSSVANYPCVGLMDELAVYNYPLSPARIVVHAQLALAKVTTNVLTLLNFDESPSDTTYANYASPVWSGTASIDTTGKGFGSGSFYLLGSDVQAQDPLLDLLALDTWTVEFFTNFNHLQDDRRFLCSGGGQIAYDNNLGIHVLIQNHGGLNVALSGGANAPISASCVTNPYVLNTRQHNAVCFGNGRLRGFVGGVKVFDIDATGAARPAGTPSQGPIFCLAHVPGEVSNGPDAYLDSLRISNVVLYTDTFLAPNGAFTGPGVPVAPISAMSWDNTLVSVASIVGGTGMSVGGTGDVLTGNGAGYGLIGQSSGKWQLEFTCTDNNSFIGMADKSNTSAQLNGGVVGANVANAFSLRDNGQQLAVLNGAPAINQSGSVGWGAGSIITIAMNLDPVLPTASVYVNGVLAWTLSLPLNVTWFPCVFSYGSASFTLVRGPLTYPQLGYLNWDGSATQLTITGSYPVAVYGLAYSQRVLVAGGNGTYLNPRDTAGVLQGIGLSVALVQSGSNWYLQLSGTPKHASTTGAITFTLAVDSGDGQTATYTQTLSLGNHAALAQFNNGEAGGLYDFNNLSTLFQDEAATIPVTYVGQTVRCVVDLTGRNNLTTLGQSSAPVLAYDALARRYGLYFGPAVSTAGDATLTVVNQTNPAFMGDPDITFMGTLKAADLANNESSSPLYIGDGATLNAMEINFYYAGSALYLDVWPDSNTPSRGTTAYLDTTETLTAVKQSDTAVLYRGDQVLTSIASTGAMALGVNYTWCLGTLVEYSRFFAGTIYNAMFISRALTQAQRAAIADDPIFNYVPPDPQWVNTLSYLRFKGDAGSTVITDETGRVWTASGAAALSAVQPMYGLTALYTGGAGLLNPAVTYNCVYADPATSVDFNFGTGDFTVEWGQYWVALDGYRSLVSYGYTGAGEFLVQASNGALTVYLSGQVVASESTPAVDGQYYRYVVQRVKGVLSIIREGIVTGQGAAPQSIGPVLSAGRSWSWGCSNSPNQAYPVIGFFAECRISNIARYPSVAVGVVSYTPLPYRFANKSMYDSAYDNAVIEDHPVARWRMQEPAINGNIAADDFGLTNGTYVETNVTLDESHNPGPPMIAGNAMGFVKSVGSYIHAPYTNAISTTNGYSVGIWIAGGPLSDYASLINLDAETRIFQLRTDVNGHLQLVHIAGTILTCQGSINVFDGHRHQVFATMDVATQTLCVYVDGVLDATVTGSGMTGGNGSSCFIGQYQAGGVYGWVGEMSNADLYNYAVPASRVAAQYAAAIPANASLAASVGNKLLLWYEMDAATIDSSGEISNLLSPTDASTQMGVRQITSSYDTVRPFSGPAMDIDLAASYCRSNYTGLRGRATYGVRTWMLASDKSHPRVILEHGLNPLPESASTEVTNVSMKYFVDIDGYPKATWQAGVNAWVPTLTASTPVDSSQGKVFMLGVDRDDTHKQVTFALNGVQDAPQTYTTSATGGTDSSCYPFVGGIPDASFTGYNAALAVQSVMVFDKPLTPAEDAWLWNQGFGRNFSEMIFGNPPSLDGWYDTIADTEMVFDFNDLTTVYQDTAGTVACKVPGQPINAIRCKLTGRLAVAQAGACVVGYDSARFCYYAKVVTGVSGNGTLFRCVGGVPTVLGGNNDISMIATAGFTADVGTAGINFPGYVGPLVPQGSDAIYLGNAMDPSFCLDFLQGGTGNGVQTTALTQGAHVLVITKKKSTNTLTGYADGQAVGSVTISPCNIQVMNLDIGRVAPAGASLYNVVLVARPITASEVTAATTAIFGMTQPVDPMLGSVVSMINVTGNQGDTFIADGVGGTWNAQLNPVIVDTSLGYPALKFTAGSPAWIQPTGTDANTPRLLWTPGTGKYTIEMWLVMPDVTDYTTTFFDGRPFGSNGAYASVAYTPGVGFDVYIHGEDLFVSAPGLISAGELFHLELSRDANLNTRLCLNGKDISGGGFYDPTSFVNQSMILGINGYNHSINPLVGFVQGFRATLDCRHPTGDFIPDAAPFYTGTGGGYDAVVLSDGPVAYWTLGDAVGSTVMHDRSGNGYDLSPLSGVTLQAQRMPDGSWSAGFDGTVNGSASVGVVPVSTTTNVAYEGWLNLTNWGNLANFHGAMMKVGIVDGTGLGVGTSDLDTAGTDVVGLAEEIAWLRPVPGGRQVPMTGWHHLAAETLPNSTMKFYLDGKMVGTATNTANPPSGSTTIGNDPNITGSRDLLAFLGKQAIYGKLIGGARWIAHYQAMMGTVTANGIDPASLSNYTLADGNVLTKVGGQVSTGVWTTRPLGSGKWVAGLQVISLPTGQEDGVAFGIMEYGANTYPGDTSAQTYALQFTRPQGPITIGTSQNTIPMTKFTPLGVGDTLYVAVDFDAKQMWFGKNAMPDVTVTADLLITPQTPGDAYVFDLSAYYTGPVLKLLLSETDLGLPLPYGFHATVSGSNDAAPTDGLNPAMTGNTLTLSNDNLTFTTASTYSSSDSISGMTGGKFYVELTATSLSAVNEGEDLFIGLCDNQQTLVGYLGGDSHGWGVQGPTPYQSDIYLYHNGAYTAVATAAADWLFTAGAVVGMAVSGDGAGHWSVWMRNNKGAWVGGGNPVAGTTPTFTVSGLAVAYIGVAAQAHQSGTAAGTVNLGATAYAMTAPAGFGPWATQQTPVLSQTLALLSGNGANGSKVFTDTTGRVWTGQGNAVISNAYAPYGTTSIYIPGDGLSYVSTPGDENMLLPDGSWTIKMQLKFNGTNTQDFLNFFLGVNQYDVFRRANGSLDFWSESGTSIISSASGLVGDQSAGEFALCNDVSDTLRMFWQGQLISTANWFTPGQAPLQLSNITLGMDPSGPGGNMNGYITDFYINAGICEHTASYTPSNTPVTL